MKDRKGNNDKNRKGQEDDEKRHNKTYVREEQ
jgi:hypothetical protein